MKIIGVDPGKTGGVAIMQNTTLSVHKMPMFTDKLINGKLLAEWFEGADFVVIEKVAAMPKQGVVSMFNFGTYYGIIQGICLGGGITHHLVRPQEWKNSILKGTAKDKAAAIEFCARAYPQTSLLPTERSRKPHDGMADAVCLLEYGRREFLRKEELAA